MIKTFLAVASLIALVLIGAATAFAVTTTCLQRLEGHSYDCRAEASNLPGFVFPTTMSVAGGQLTLGAGGTPLTCSCAALGSFNTPKYNASPTKWICVGAEDNPGPQGIVIQGTVGASGKINKVTGASSQGDTLLLDCDLQ